MDCAQWRRVEISAPPRALPSGIRSPDPPRREAANGSDALVVILADVTRLVLAPRPGGGLAPVAAQFSHERVPMVLHYAPDDRDEAARLVAASRDTFPTDEPPGIVLRALRTLVAVLDSRHSPDGVVTVAALTKAARADR